ncbi:diaminopimelate decarboxylase [Francisella halioticida]|uniref:Diaminopimelate decarboxylase n=1 Tax=Francisella halioticida TaxID=549298 RepID=A0ABM6LXN4_9GAMM|nr:PLP-dependent decarboxylase [Francisella halioticida]ASG67293.1 diaminopimelate decarboxylase [Francisella halioticida]BCD92449.1 diaminopimelate decarboxylase [Francisella halioticida]
MFSLDLHKENLLGLAKEIDSPFFLYDLDILEDNLESLKKMPVKLWYAVKANPLSNIIQSIYDQEISFDVASSGELDQVLRQGVDPKNILNTGPAKSYKQICYFIEKGVRIFVLESIQQYEDLLKAARNYNVQVTSLLRVQISWNISSEKNVLGGDSVTPFGLSPVEWKNYFIKNPIKNEYVNIIGLHCFQWGNILDVEKLFYLWSIITETLVELADQISMDLKVIDLGGGLGIPYYNQDNRMKVENVVETLNQLKIKYPQVDFWLELGRYAVGECGVYVTQVIDRKKVYDKNLLVLEGGSQHLGRPFITNQAFPVSNISTNSENSLTMELHGPLCTGIDHLGSVALPESTEAGDYLVFTQTGAYGFTESMPFFLCHTLPAEVIYKKNEIRIVRQSKKASEWLV